MKTNKPTFIVDIERLLSITDVQKQTILQWLENYLLSIEKDGILTLKEVIQVINFARSLNFIKFEESNGELFSKFRKYDNNTSEIEETK
jgi:hypothetical protein